MPPLHVELSIGDKKIDLPDIPPYLPGSFTDADPSGSSILVVSCNPDDDGGFVYRQEVQDTTEVFGRKGRVVSGDAGELEAVIGTGERVELSITTKFGKGVLSLKHYGNV